MGLCLAAAGVVKSLAVASFMLSWADPVGDTEWQEDWRVTPQGLAVVEARVKGSGAGMEALPDAPLVDGWFRWTPQLPVQREVTFRNSGMAGEWRLCTGGACRDFSAILGRPLGGAATTVSVCRPDQVTGALDAKTLLARGDEFSLRGEYDRAIADYDAALKIDPAFADALNSRGVALRAKGERRRALSDFDAAIRLRPNFEAARAHRKSLFGEIERLGARMPLKDRKN